MSRLNPDRLTLLEVTDNYLTRGIFHYLDSIGMPWTSEGTLFPEKMNALYYEGHSGSKLISPLLSRNLTNGKLTETTMISLAEMIDMKYRQNWNHLYEITKAEYDPLHNYNISEHRTRDLDSTDIGTIGTEEESTGSGSLTKGTQEQSTTQYGRTVDSTDTLTHNTTQTDTGSGSITHGEQIRTVIDDRTDSLHSMYGIGVTSDIGSPADRTMTDYDSDKTETHSGTDNTTNSNTSRMTGTDTDVVSSEEGGSDTNTVVNSGTDRTTSTNEKTDTTTRNLASTEDEEVTITRSGVTGVSQAQLLSDELNFWRWNFLERVFIDVDEVMCLSVFSSYY